MKEMWDERYSQEAYAYGEEPNAFFKACIDQLPAPGRILLPAEGEGRNAVYAARQGWKVDAFDISAAGREKASRLAARFGVHIDYQVADYENARIDTGAYDAIALIFAHIHESHRRLASAIASGGRVILEAYGRAAVVCRRRSSRRLCRPRGPSARENRSRNPRGPVSQRAGQRDQADSGSEPERLEGRFRLSFAPFLTSTCFLSTIW